jgi:hypothetical protein
MGIFESFEPFLNHPKDSSKQSAVALMKNPASQRTNFKSDSAPRIIDQTPTQLTHKFQSII